MKDITLRDLTGENLQAIIDLRVAPGQESFVASNARSVAQAASHPVAWIRAIYAEEEPVGLIMLHDENLKSDPERDDYYFLWRLMIDARSQGKGYGRRAVEILKDHVRTRPNGRVLLTSCHTGEGSPLGFYQRIGFSPTGEKIGDELELSIPLREET